MLIAIIMYLILYRFEPYHLSGES